MKKEWIEDSGTLPPLFPRIAFRDITNRTNNRTVIAALIPHKILLQNTAPFLFWSRGDEKDEAYLLGIMNSHVFDWFSRRFVEGHLSFYILNSLPVPRPSRDSVLWQRVVEISGQLASVDKRFKNWAAAVGVKNGPLTEGEKTKLINELDAVVSHLYSLSREDVEVIFETFHESWDYAEWLASVLKYYEEWRKKK
jgi:phenylpyruvate tautomerase PptA (4-oxalocrotonate tautomerase family)